MCPPVQLTHLVRYLADELVVFVNELIGVPVDDLLGQKSGDVADAMINSQQFAVQREQSVVLVLQRFKKSQLLERISLNALNKPDKQVLWFVVRLLVAARISRMAIGE